MELSQTFEGLAPIILLLIVFIGIAYILIIPICVAVIAGNKGRSGFLWFLLSILINPFFAILILIALGDTDEKRRQKVIEDEKTRQEILNSYMTNNTNTTKAEPDYSRYMPH